jgi:ribosome-associated protein
MVDVDPDELEWKFTASGGPGGQHANTSNTKVEVRFDVETSASLSEWQRARLLERLGPVVRVVASERRSQAQNRELALERLQSKLAAALHVDPARRPSKPSRSAVEKRLDDKKRQSERKAARRSRREDD